MESVMHPREDWPMEKFKQAMARQPASPAVLLATGALSPISLAHLQLLQQAKLRLEQHGYYVCSGWLAARREAVLSTAFRLRLAELATEGDEFVSIASWEASDDHAEAVRTLQSALAKAFPGVSVPVLLVCGSDERPGILLPSHGQGYVLVPRGGEDCLLERPQEMAFVAAPLPGRLRGSSGRRVRAAFKGDDMAYVSQVMPPAAARAVLEPTAAERAEFRADLAVLAAAAAVGPWPCAKFAQRLPLMPEERVLAVLVASGTMCPPHRGHVLVLHKARRRLEEAGYSVVAAWLVPAGDAELSGGFRQRVAELSVCDDDLTSAGEALAAAPPPREAAAALLAHLRERFALALEGVSLKSFYVCGDDARGLHSGFRGEGELGVVIVPRAGDEEQLLMERPHQLVFVAEPLASAEAALSSTHLLQLIRAKNTAQATQAMSLSAARFTLAPTSAERLVMQADFDKLGIAGPEASELVSMQDSLKQTFKSWGSPAGTLNAEDLGRLLRLLDPSWTNLELAALFSQAAANSDGRVVLDDFIDWIFNCGLQPAAAA